MFTASILQQAGAGSSQELKLTLESAELWQAEAGVGRTVGGAAAAVQAGAGLTALWDYSVRKHWLFHTSHNIGVAADVFFIGYLQVLQMSHIEGVLIKGFECECVWLQGLFQFTGINSHVNLR